VLANEDFVMRVYAAPQSVCMFAINGSTTTWVKDKNAPRETIIGADVIPSLSSQENTAVLFSKRISDSNHIFVNSYEDFLSVCQLFRYNTSRNRTSSCPAKQQRPRMAASPATTGKEHCLCELSFLLPSV
jgi:hypothetical protein